MVVMREDVFECLGRPVVPWELGLACGAGWLDGPPADLAAPVRCLALPL